MRRNRLRDLLNAGQPTLGTHLHISWPSVTELVGSLKGKATAKYGQSSGNGLASAELFMAQTGLTAQRVNFSRVDGNGYVVKRFHARKFFSDVLE